MAKGASMAGKFEVYQDKGGGFRFRLKASNGQTNAHDAEVVEAGS